MPAGRLPDVCCPPEPVDLSWSGWSRGVSGPLAGQCGEREVTGGPGKWRVVGGVVARIHSHPWIAALGYREAGGEVEYNCGGSLVTSRHVITAAHCVTEQLSVVTLGEHNIKQDNDMASPESVTISKVTTHEEYNRKSQDNDIAVIRLARDLTFSRAIRPVCLPSTSDNLRGDKVGSGQGGLEFLSKTKIFSV